MNPRPIVELDDVGFAFGEHVVLEQVSLAVGEGEFLGLVGPNGSGKTTLLKLVLGLLDPSHGRVRVLGGPPRESRTELGYVPQSALFARDFPISVEDTVLMGRLGRSKTRFGHGTDDRRVAERAMDETGVLSLRRRHIGTLSGGQLQRVLIARALAAEPKLLIMDEPTSNVDAVAEEDIFELLMKLNAHATIIVVSHDIGFISRHVGRVACLNRTLSVHETSSITGEIIEKLYRGHVHMIRHTHS